MKILGYLFRVRLFLDIASFLGYTHYSLWIYTRMQLSKISMR